MAAFALSPSLRSSVHPDHAAIGAATQHSIVSSEGVLLKESAAASSFCWLLRRPHQSRSQVVARTSSGVRCLHPVVAFGTDSPSLCLLSASSPARRVSPTLGPVHGSLTTTRHGRGGRGGALVCQGLFGLGLPELLVIGGVAVILFGPKQLPEIGKSLGKTVKGFQEAAKEFQTELKAAAKGEEPGKVEELEKIPAANAPPATPPAADKAEPK